MEDLEALTVEQVAFTPGPGKWSVRQAIGHLVISEREIFKCIPEKPQKGRSVTSLRNRICYILVVIVLKLGLPVPVVSYEMEPEGRSSLTELHRQWNENHRWLRSLQNKFQRMILSALFSATRWLDLSHFRNQYRWIDCISIPTGAKLGGIRK